MGKHTPLIKFLGPRLNLAQSTELASSAAGKALPLSKDVDHKPVKARQIIYAAQRLPRLTLSREEIECILVQSDQV